MTALLGSVAPASRRPRLRSRAGSPSARKPGDRAVDDRRDHRPVPPPLARVRVREVHLDLHALEHRERVGDRVRVVRERAGVDHDRRAPAARAVDRVDRARLRGSTAGARRRGRAWPRSRSPARPARRASSCRSAPARARPSRFRFGPESNRIFAIMPPLESRPAPCAPRPDRDRRPVRSRSDRRART